MQLFRLLTPLRGIVLLFALSLTLPALAQTLMPEQMANRGYDYDIGRGVVQSDAEAVRWYSMAAAAGKARGAEGPCTSAPGAV